MAFNAVLSKAKIIVVNCRDFENREFAQINSQNSIRACRVRNMVSWATYGDIVLKLLHR